MSDTADGQPDLSSEASSSPEPPNAAPTSPPPPGPPPAAPPAPAPLSTVPGRQQPARAGGYPIDMDVESPDQIARWRPLVQWILAIPLFIVVYVLRIVAEVCALVGWFAALFTGELPEVLGNLIAGYYRYAWKTYSYAWFLRDQYPSFALEMGYDDPGRDQAWFEVRRGQGLSRLSVLLRIFLVIPQLIVIFFLGIAVSFAVFVAFFAVLFTGRWPGGLRDFVVGGLRWILRVDAWFYLLADPYPPFSLN